jgi:transcriptional repressor NrdR
MTVTNSRDGEENTIRRRRECTLCKRRVNTIERFEIVPLTVIKASGARQLFDVQKIVRGIKRATQKRPVSQEQIDTIATEVERKLESEMKSEITSEHIGELVAAALKSVDSVAYIRFVSVYRKFENAESFVKEITGMGKGDAE